jgi:hypothetical protein
MDVFFKLNNLKFNVKHQENGCLSRQVVQNRIVDKIKDELDQE